jgi:transposase InsO family protein
VIDDDIIGTVAADGNGLASFAFLSRIQPQFCLLTEEELHKLASWLSKGKVKLGDIDGHYHIKTTTLMSKFASHGISVTIQRGRPKKEIPREKVSQVFKYRDKYNVGYKRAACALQNHDFSITASETRKIYQEEFLYLYAKKKLTQNSHYRRYVAKYKNQLWHVDLHNWDSVLEGTELKKRYLIAFIDDRTRYIIHHEVLKSKTAEAASESLRKALSKHPHPYMITADNGGEFRGKPFTKTAKENCILMHFTRPYSPEENAKIERWWRTAEESLIDHDDLDDLVNEYNEFWPHQALAQMGFGSMTPAQAWNTMQSYNDQPDITLTYYLAKTR